MNNTNGLNLPPCKGFFGKIFGHKFEPRYDTEPSGENAKVEAVKLITDKSQEILESIEYLETVISSALSYFSDNEKATYVCDVCSRCGTIIKR